MACVPLIFKQTQSSRGYYHRGFLREATLGINTERDIEANMQIGPTDAGMVRIFVESQGIEVPMDFEPEEAEEIAEEIRSAIAQARAVQQKSQKKR